MLTRIRLSASYKTLRTDWCFTATVALSASYESALLSSTMAYATITRANQGFASDLGTYYIPTLRATCSILLELLCSVGLPCKAYQRLGCYLGHYRNYALLCDQHYSSRIHPKKELPDLLHIAHRHCECRYSTLVPARIAHSYLHIRSCPGGGSPSRISGDTAEDVPRNHQTTTWYELGADSHTTSTGELSGDLETGAARLSQQTLEQGKDADHL